MAKPHREGRRQLALGLTAGAALIAVAVGAMLLLVLGAIWLVHLSMSQFT
jgi:hypothetical protein